MCLWVRGQGELAALVERSVALVGSRAATRYGETVAADLAAGLAVHRVTTISGAAFGIDAAAHRGALTAGKPTVAVLACGADRSYPAAHGVLLDSIAEDGCVVSEVPPGAIPTRWRFLERNRIIAALAGGTVVVEAAWRSGALNTAKHAGELNRPVGAVPGPVTSPASAGCHKLIREGHTCITDAADLVELIAPIGTRADTESLIPVRPHDGLAPDELRVWEALAPDTWLSVPQLCLAAGMNETIVQQLLGELTLQGRARSKPGGAGRLLWRRAARRAGVR